MRLLLIGLLLSLIGCSARQEPPLMPFGMDAPPVGYQGLTLLSWNVHGLPWPLSRDPCGRLDTIARTIRATSPDVVVLQEVWLRRYERQLAHALEDAYTPYFQDRGGLVPGPKGGLLVFVRRGRPWQARTETPEFVRYQHTATGHLSEGDSIAGKGVLRLDLVGERSVCLLATHLQSQYPEKGVDHLYVKERIGQLQELSAVEHSCDGMAILVVGDFNTAPDEHDVYDPFVAPLGADLTTNARAECDHGCGSHFTADGARYEWIDYIISPTTAVGASVQRISNKAVDQPYSDHDGLLAWIGFEGKPQHGEP